jgi:hypothetical protein
VRIWETDRRNDHAARIRHSEERADAVGPTPSANRQTSQARLNINAANQALLMVVLADPIPMNEYCAAK